MSILYVTSFAQDMYEDTGQRLVKSFLKRQMEAGQKLLICYEDFEYDLQAKSDSDRILTYPLHESEYLRNWLTENADVIPDYLGGTATEESHPKIFKSVDLPDPEEPIIETNSPSFICKSKPFKTCKESLPIGYDLCKLCSLIIK